MTFALDANIVIHLIIGTATVMTRFDECIVHGASIVIPPYVDY